MAIDLETLDFSDLAPTQTYPSDVQHDDGYMASWDESDLYWQAWFGDDEPEVCIALMHGYGEHSARYHHVASAFVRVGWAVMAIDARGHGRSVGKRGHIDSHDDYVRDFDMLIGAIRKRWPGKPVFVLGHSNGGLIALRHALKNDNRIEGYVVTSPFCGIKADVPFIKALAGDLMSKIYPGLAMPTGLDAAGVSRDPNVVSHYSEDPLNHGMTTARWFTETKDAHADLLERSKQITHPFFFLVAGSDQLVEPRASEEVYHRMGSHDRQFEIQPELFHEVLNEEPWQDLMREIIGWIDERRPEAS